jgi:Xaa-Pro aminopeptidase
MLKTRIDFDHRTRRQALMANDSDATFVFFGASEVKRNDDVDYPFRQDSTFYYLTGFDEPGAALVLSRGESYLFVRDRDLNSEIWEGERYGTERAKTIFEMDQAESIRSFYLKLEELIAGTKRVYVQLTPGTGRTTQLLEVVAKASKLQGKGAHGMLPVMDPAAFLAKMRVIKDPAEQKQMRRICELSAQAHLHLLKTVRPGMSEQQAAAEFQYFLMSNGATDLGYGPIFAGGKNATTLHYVRNNENLNLGDLLLVDAAGELDHYTADITQTFPVGRAFSVEQKTVYEHVLHVNRAIAALVKPGVTYRQLHQKSCELVTEALMDLGVLQGKLSELVEKKEYRKFYMHGLGHFLGLDVHDAGIYDHHGVDVKLEPGMILTNEPGLYFRDATSPYAGIGVRIEDDLLVTETGAENLTASLLREPREIENLREQAFKGVTYSS